jgi:hypothetical protein
MGRWGSRIRAVWATDVDLREIGRRTLEDRERQDAMSRAAQAGGIAATAVPDLPVLSEADAALYGAQLRRIDEGVWAVPHVDTLLKPDDAQRSKSRQLSDSIECAERVELLHHAV